MLDVLQAEFSPPLDSSLIAAIIADYVSEEASASSEDQIHTCRAVLSQLAAQAEKELLDEDTLSEQLANVQISSYSVTDETSSSIDISSQNTSRTASSSPSNTPSQYSFSSPLGFLRAAFPHISISNLQSNLNSFHNAEDIDMGSVVESLLSSEYVRELEERGLDGLNEDDLHPEYEQNWLVVEGRQKGSTKTTKKTTKKRGTTYSLVDIRQRHHERNAPTSTLAPPDPWTQLSSVASYLSTLIPAQSASFFQSAFHDPNHPTPTKALRAALRAVTSSASSSNLTSIHDADVTPEETHLLFSITEVLNAEFAYADLNVEERDQLMEDALLCLRATKGQPDTALDIVRLLRELEGDFESGQLTWGIYHSPVPSTSVIAAHSSQHKATKKLPASPPPVPPPPRLRSVSPGKHKVPAPSPSNTWQTVPQRQPAGPHPLADSIPAYRRKVRSGGKGLGKGGKGDVGELAVGHRLRARELMTQRREALREAGKAWQKGTTKTRGGEVAFYYAERARELQQQAHQEQLDAARQMVLAKRSTSASRDTVDLHGTTVTEAIHIIKDILRDGSCSTSKPLHIITGRGTHSTNGVGVLGPAIKSALVGDGWLVGSYDGGLVVRGKSTRNS